MRALFGRDSSKPCHRSRIEHVDDAGIAYGQMEAFVHAIAKPGLPGARMERDQHP